jgi:hypothetical protein
MNSKRIAAVCFLGLIATLCTFSQQFESDSFTLSIMAGQGRFSIASKTDGETTPLFVADDLTTSYFKLLLNDRIYVLGDSFAFRQNSEINDNGGSITWTSPRITVQATFDCTRASYVTIDVEITNIAEANQEVGLRHLLDTYLGEQGDHFVLPTGPVSSEIELIEAPRYIQSGTADTAQLFIVYDAYGATLPDRIVLANWKRLDEVNWGYTINSNRSFNYSPYSINDSAVSTYFEPVELGPGESRVIRTILATDIPGGSAVTSSGSTTSGDGTEASVAGAFESIINTRVVSIDNLITTIDELLKTERDPTVEELALLRSAIESIKEQHAQMQ